MTKASSPLPKKMWEFDQQLGEVMIFKAEPRS